MASRVIGPRAYQSDLKGAIMSKEKTKEAPRVAVMITLSGVKAEGRSFQPTGAPVDVLPATAELFVKRHMARLATPEDIEAAAVAPPDSPPEQPEPEPEPKKKTQPDPPKEVTKEG